MKNKDRIAELEQNVETLTTRINQLQASVNRCHAERLRHTHDATTTHSQAEEKPKWEELPDWMQWIAQDQDGKWCGYAKRPAPLGYGWWSRSMGEYATISRGQQNLWWRETLEQRPAPLKEHKPNWDTLPNWVQWIAQDQSGEWWGYKYEPKKQNDYWVGAYGSLLLFQSVSNPSWKETLESRPVKNSAPDWIDTPHWARWLAQDSDGRWYAYSKEPCPGIISWQQQGGEWACVSDGPCNPEWKKTLQKRPYVNVVVAPVFSSFDWIPASPPPSISHKWLRDVRRAFRCKDCRTCKYLEVEDCTCPTWNCNYPCSVFDDFVDRLLSSSKLSPDEFVDALLGKEKK